MKGILNNIFMCKLYNDDDVILLPSKIIKCLIEKSFNDGFNSKATSSEERENMLHNEYKDIFNCLNRMEKKGHVCIQKTK